jgi:hypothetical protein
MKNILVRSRYAMKTAYFFLIAFRNNLIAEFLDRRFINRKRYWSAIGTLGAGKVSLGKVNQHEATEKVCKFATVISCDVEMAIIFYKERD